MTNHRYIVKVDEKVVWEGLDLMGEVDAIIRNNPGGKIAIEWVPNREDILIV